MAADTALNFVFLANLDRKLRSTSYLKITSRVPFKFGCGRLIRELASRFPISIQKTELEYKLVYHLSYRCLQKSLGTLYYFIMTVHFFKFLFFYLILFHCICTY